MNFKKAIVSGVLLTTVICNIRQTAKALTQEIIDTNRKASLTIVQYETEQGQTENKPLNDVEVTIYKVPESKETVEDAESYRTQNNLQGISKTTGEDGTALFTDLDLGRYLVVETNAPKNVITKMESFLIDLPRSNDSGLWEYDVTVEPKNTTLYGKISLRDVDLHGNPIQGIEWKLQKQDTSGTWVDYEDVDPVTTDESGKIFINNLILGTYRLVQTKVPQGYIYDPTKTATFTINKNNYNFRMEVRDEKFNIEKYVKLSDETYGKKVGTFTTDTISWKVEADCSSTTYLLDKYSIIETVPEGLTIDLDSLKVYGEEDELTLNSDYKLDIQGNVITINIEKGAIRWYDKAVVIYDTKFDCNNVHSGNFESKSNLVYTDKLDDYRRSTSSTYTTEDTVARVYTGELVCKKIDEEGNFLQGAKFKIATSEENAKNGIFVKDIEGNDVVSVSDGYFRFYGLKLGEDNQDYENAVTSYWLVEFETPTYQENGATKHYNLLASPLEVQVTSTSGEVSENTTTIINKKGFKLPLTGGKLNIIPLAIGTAIIVLAIVIKKKENRAKK